MQNKHAHFSLNDIKPTIASLESAAQKLLQNAGGSEAVLKDALGLIQKAMASEDVPVALVKEVVELVVQAISAQAKA